MCVCKEEKKENSQGVPRGVSLILSPPFFYSAATTAEPASTGITGTAASAPRASRVQTVGSVSINPDSRSSLIPG